MQKIRCKLTIFFDAPFWVGVYERESDGIFTACRIVFGGEPKESDVYEFMLENWAYLRFGSPVAAEIAQDKKRSPKRAQREAKRMLSASGVGTKAQQAIKLSQQEGKEARKKISRARKLEAQQRQFDLRQQKKKEKHKGH